MLRWCVFVMKKIAVFEYFIHIVNDTLYLFTHCLFVKRSVRRYEFKLLCTLHIALFLMESQKNSEICNVESPCCSCKYLYEFFESFNLVSIKAHKLKLSDDSDETFKCHMTSLSQKSSLYLHLAYHWYEFLCILYLVITNFYLLVMYYYNSSPWCNITNFNHVIYFDLVKEKSHFSVMTQNHIHCHWPHCILITVHNQNLSWQYCKIS